MVMKRRVPGILENLLKNKEETRYANLAYVSIVLLTILSFRLFFMQIIEGSYYKQEADGNRIRTLPIIASRGVMYDRNLNGRLTCFIRHNNARRSKEE